MLQHRFIDSALKAPNKIAFIDRSTRRNVSYREALLGVLLLAPRLHRLERGRIGIMLPTSAAAALAVIAAVVAGRTPVMINYSTGAQRNCEYARRKCDFSTVITTRSLLEKTGCTEQPYMVYIEDLMARAGRLSKALAWLKSRLPAGLLKLLCGRTNLARPAVILFTSGSEKEPKGVQLSQRNILSNIDAFSEMMELAELDRLLAVLPYFHVFGLTINLWTPLCLGMTSITYANPLEFKTVARLIREEKPQILVGTPVFLEGYLRHAQPGDFASVVLAVSGADRCPETLRQQFRDQHGLDLIEGYGTTETSPVISANPRNANRPGSIGKPIPGVEVRIQDIDSGEFKSPGEIGKILVRGDNVMQGYLNDMEETHYRVKSGWYDTGDLGYQDTEGYLWHKGRLKRFVKIGGEMVSLVAVEEAINAVTPETVECCVVELPDSRRGSRIVAVTSQDVDRQQVVRQLTGKIPNLALPKDYVTITDFPRMGSGKTDFRSLTQLVRARYEERTDKSQAN